jgi:menaquinone-dependent protoporphyrinogen oxidase
MRLLILAGSKHGATLEVAETIGERLVERGLEVEVAEVGDDHAPLAGFDGVIVGSAVYAGHWFKAAKRWVVTHREAVAERPTWLFSVGPLGDPPEPQEDPVDVADLITAIDARDHHLFAGALAKDDLSLVERATVKAVHAPFGDFRDWDEIEGWADKIADDLGADVGRIPVAG